MGYYIPRTNFITAYIYDHDFFLKYAGTAHKTGLHFFENFLLVKNGINETRALPGDYICYTPSRGWWVETKENFERYYEPTD